MHNNNSYIITYSSYIMQSFSIIIYASVSLCICISVSVCACVYSVHTIYSLLLLVLECVSVFYNFVLFIFQCTLINISFIFFFSTLLLSLFWLFIFSSAYLVFFFLFLYPSIHILWQVSSKIKYFSAIAFSFSILFVAYFSPLFVLQSVYNLSIFRCSTSFFLITNVLFPSASFIESFFLQYVYMTFCLQYEMDNNTHKFEKVKYLLESRSVAARGACR